MYFCIAAIPNNGGKCVQIFYEDTEAGRRTAEAFVREFDRPGWGVYDCVSPLKEKRRAKDAVAEIRGLHFDIDARQVGETKEQIIARVRAKLGALGILSRIVDSGRGVHVYTTFKEAIEPGTPETERALGLLDRMVRHLAADPAPAHMAALMRRPGTVNSKEGGGPCREIFVGALCDPTDVETYLDLVEDNGPLFTAQEKSEPDKLEDAPIDIEAELASMLPGDTTGRGVNATQVRVMTSLIWRAEHPEDIAKRIVDATMEMADCKQLGWNRKDEEDLVNERIGTQYRTLFEKEYDCTTGAIPIWLPMEFHQRWAAALAEGRRPTVSKNGAGWHIRSYGAQEANGEDAKAGDTPKDEAPREGAPRAPFILRTFEPFDVAQLPQREFLFGRHYQRRVVSGTVAPGGTGKSSLVMVESVAMATGRDLMDEGKAKERLRVWYHNGEDNMLELKRRLAAICQYYEIPQEELRDWFFMTSGNEVPLRVAESYNQVRLSTDLPLVKQITEAIGDNKIDVANLDPLVTLHGATESSPGHMDQVIRIFNKIADTRNCAIDLSHHTRKLPPGATAEDYILDDMRGAKAISDAMRAVRILNYMSPKDATDNGLEIERTSYFRIDRGKGNYSAPSKEATWRRFQNVDLPNGDAVGVVIPWNFPGQDAPPSPARQEAERKAEHVFMEILRRLTLADRFVGEHGTNNAPHVLSKEREAKMAKVGKAALDAAMRRLFDRGVIKLEEYIKANRHPGTRIVEK
jgi:RecA-family ATPase